MSIDGDNHRNQHQPLIRNLLPSPADPERNLAIKGPERELVRAVLQSGLNEAFGFIVGQKHEHAEISRRARGWISRDDWEPLSFTWCCDALDIHPRVIRDLLLPDKWEWTKQRLTHMQRANCGYGTRGRNER